MALVDAAAAIEQGDNPTAIEQASTAWHLGAKAMEFSSSLKALDLQLQDAATKMAAALEQVVTHGRIAR